MRCDSPPDRVGPLHVDQETQTAGNLLDQLGADEPAVASELQSGQEVVGLTDGHVRDIHDGFAADRDA